jgi:hypothetical protein
MNPEQYKEKQMQVRYDFNEIKEKHKVIIPYSIKRNA